MRKVTMLYKILFSLDSEQKIRRFKEEVTRKEDVKLVRKNKQFFNIHKGKRCFIVGNGPSINKLELASLQNEIVFTVNQSTRIENFWELKSNYHIWVDENFFNLDRNKAEDMELLDIMKAVKTCDNSPVVFYKTSAKNMIKEFELENNLNIHYVMDGNINMETPNTDFPIDRPIPVFATCIHYAIIIAVYMGFSEIILLGCDCTGLINIINARMEESGKFEYAYKITKNELVRMREQNKRSKMTDEIFWYSRLFRTYGVLYQYCKKRNCKLLNATQGTILDEVPRVDINDIL